MQDERVLILTDLHLGGVRWKPRDGQPDHYGEIAETDDERAALKTRAVEAAFRYAIRQGVHHLLLGGDVLDQSGDEKGIRQEASHLRDLIVDANLSTASTDGNHEERLRKANHELTIPKLFGNSVRHDPHFISREKIVTVLHGHQFDHATRNTHAHEWLGHQSIPEAIDVHTIGNMLDWLSLAAFRSSSHLLGLNGNNLAELPTVDECRKKFLSCLAFSRKKMNGNGQSPVPPCLRVIRETVGAHLASFTHSNAVVLGHSHHPRLFETTVITKKGKWRKILVGNAGGFKEPLKPITAIEAGADSLTLLEYVANGRNDGNFVRSKSIRREPDPVRE